MKKLICFFLTLAMVVTTAITYANTVTMNNKGSTDIQKMLPSIQQPVTNVVAGNLTSVTANAWVVQQDSKLIGNSFVPRIDYVNTMMIANESNSKPKSYNAIGMTSSNTQMPENVPVVQWRQHSLENNNTKGMNLQPAMELNHSSSSMVLVVNPNFATTQ